MSKKQSWQLFATSPFLVRWLKTALKQKRFHRCVAAEIVSVD
ncbi:TPA: DUF2913 family protein [Morganella morganii]|nr:DUF2913 family protein [Morganella morganii]